MRRTLLFIFLAIVVFQLKAQQKNGNPLWQKKNMASIHVVQQNALNEIANNFSIFQLNDYELSETLQELTSLARNSQFMVMPFPSVAGHVQRFKIRTSNTLHPDLLIKYPQIKTYEGIGIDDPSALIRFETINGVFSGMIWSTHYGTQVIRKADHSQNDYMVYTKRSAKSRQSTHFTCHTDHIDQINLPQRQQAKSRGNDGLLRTYRLALAATTEYTQFHGGSIATALGAMAITLNRVNGILKRDVAVELQLIPNNDLLIFDNSAPDGYSNEDGSAMLDENQIIIDNTIGTDNYDIGHVFSTGGGGVAYLSSVCISSVKAGGVTGAQLPQGDPFDVDFVAHEIGHQLGATHTQNNDCNSISATSVEPGSGSTIMGYAGICFPNVQNNTDDYFHSISIDQINGVITGVGNDCAIKTPTGNQQPVADSGADYFIPHSTPFELEGSATDPDGDVLSFTWEQIDNQSSSMPPVNTATEGPLFRSLPPSDSPIRQFPAKGINNAHASSTWEVIPTVSRNLNFRFTARDNFLGGGNTNGDDVLITVTSGAGPFNIKVPNGGEEIAAGISQEITWNVAGSNLAPISCSNVDIFLSFDGGESYPVILAENIANDGSQEVIIPINFVSDKARIKIKGRDNVFFDVSDNNFQITAPLPGFSLEVSEKSLKACPDTSLSIQVNVVSVNDFEGEVALSVLAPTELRNFSFQSPTISTGTSTALTFDIPENTPPGVYNIDIRGTSDNKSFTRTIVLKINDPSLAGPILSTPVNNALEVSPSPTFEWSVVDDATTYQLEISNDPEFSDLVYAIDNLNTNMYSLPYNLPNGEIFYWRVSASNDCDKSDFSETRKITISNTLCFEYSNTQTYSISPEVRTTISAPIIITESGTLKSIKVSFDISHSWIGDLSVTLESPSGTRASILQEICGNEDRINLIFSHEGLPHNTIPCEPPVSSNPYLPQESFDRFIGEEVNGTWTLYVSDNYILDGGTLNSWNMEICRGVSSAPPLNVLISNTSNPICNGASNGSILATIIGGSPNYTINWSNGASQLALGNLKAGTYDLTVTDENGDSATASASLTEPTAITLESVLVNATCNGVNNGSIQVFPSGGTPEYQYQWANGVRQYNNLHLPDGNYQLTVTDKNGCTVTQSYTVTEPAALVLNLSSNKAINGINGSIDLEVAGGLPPYTYKWNNGAETQDLSELAPGLFEVTVTDANGCSATAQEEVLLETTGQACYNVTINITLDNYGEENRWEISDGNGEIIAQDGPFNNFENGAVKTTNICLPPGCYDFRIFDLWGDGMCCAYGQGGYEIVEEETGQVIASGDNFSKEEVKTICIPTDNSGEEVRSYCGANGRNTQYEWIETVEIAGQVFNSGNNDGYGDFSDTEIEVPIGSTLDLALTPGFGFFEYPENWQVWIDLNRDGDFEDPGEDVFITAGKERVTGTIGIPVSATPGKTRIRFAMKWGNLITPCESFSWGEVEDYTLNLVELPKIGERVVSLVGSETTLPAGHPTIYTIQDRIETYELNLYPNPATQFIELEWPDQSDKTYDLIVINTFGQLIMQRKVQTREGLNKVRIPLADHPPGLYLLNLRNKNKVRTKEFVITR